MTDYFDRILRLNGEYASFNNKKKLYLLLDYKFCLCVCSPRISIHFPIRIVLMPENGVFLLRDTIRSYLNFMTQSSWRRITLLRPACPPRRIEIHQKRRPDAIWHFRVFFYASKLSVSNSHKSWTSIYYFVCTPLRPIPNFFRFCVFSNHISQQVITAVGFVFIR